MQQNLALGRNELSTNAGRRLNERLDGGQSFLGGRGPYRLTSLGELRSSDRMPVRLAARATNLDEAGQFATFLLPSSFLLPPSTSRSTDGRRHPQQARVSSIPIDSKNRECREGCGSRQLVVTQRRIAANGLAPESAARPFRRSANGARRDPDANNQPAGAPRDHPTGECRWARARGSN